MADWPQLIGPAESVAQRLLGATLIREIDGYVLTGKIVEAEAYEQNDAASHSYKGRTPRTEIMFGPAGFLYVYFTYGMHHCMNIVTGLKGEGSAVLIRAIEPIGGLDIMRRNRNKKLDGELTNGPAKLCQAFGIDKHMNGHDMRQSPFRLQVNDRVLSKDIVQTTRIGISQAKDVPWRFYLRGNAFVSHA